MTSYYAMSRSDAQRYLHHDKRDDSVPDEDLTRKVGDGDLINLEVLDRLHDDLVEMIRRNFPATLRKQDPKGGEFERAACVVVHKALASYPIEVTGDPEFWTWLAVTRFRDIVEWRFGEKPALENFGVGSSKENLLYRLWVRADIGRDPSAEDEYELAKVGDQDLWRSHIIRQRYGSRRQVARSLLRLQANKLSFERLDTSGIRELAKRLSRLRANVFFELLSPAGADALILDLCRDLQTTKGKME